MDKTIEDTLINIKQYEAARSEYIFINHCMLLLYNTCRAKHPHSVRHVLFFGRIEYDAYRTDLEELNLGPRDANTLPKIELSQQQFQIHREKYEKMRNDVSVKLKFLEENKVCEMYLLQSAACK